MSRFIAGFARMNMAERDSHGGRPPKSVLLRELVLKIARETGFGLAHNLGELRKLGIG